MRVETQAVPDRLDRAFRSAAEATGTPFRYLLATARRESGLDAAAKAPTSSATGLFQFIESTWLQMVKEEGPGQGLGDYAGMIERKSSGGYRVADPRDRAAILALRKDPQAAALMAGAFTRRNAEHLADSLGRAPTEGELYAAHFLGAQGAGRLIAAAGETPEAAAAGLFPTQAAANRRIFYERDGTARSVAAVYAALTAPHGAAPIAVAEAPPAQPAADAAALFGRPAGGSDAARATAIPSRFAIGYAAAEGSVAAEGRRLTDAAFATAPLGRFSPLRAQPAIAPPSVAAAGAGATEALPFAPADGIATPAPLPRTRPSAVLPLVETAPERLDTATVPLPRIRPAPGTAEAGDTPFDLLKVLGFTRA